MKTVILKITLIFIFYSFALLNCTKDKNRNSDPVKTLTLDMISFNHSDKGWELYSWPNGNDWNYSILPGTNRLKSYEEVTTNKIIVPGKDSLKMLLGKLPENEQIFWISETWLKNIWGNNYGSLSLPDQNTVDDIKTFCNQRKLM